MRVILTCYHVIIPRLPSTTWRSEPRSRGWLARAVLSSTRGCGRSADAHVLWTDRRQQHGSGASASGNLSEIREGPSGHQGGRSVFPLGGAAAKAIWGHRGQQPA